MESLSLCKYHKQKVNHPPQPSLDSGVFSSNIQSWNFKAESKGERKKKKKNQGYIKYFCGSGKQKLKPVIWETDLSRNSTHHCYVVSTKPEHTCNMHFSLGVVLPSFT